MTTKVTIKLDTPSHQDALVEQFNPQDGKVYGGTKRLTDGEEVQLYVHSHMALRITEVAKVVDPKPE